MNQLLSVVEDKIVINKLRLNLTEGTITHIGDLNVRGAVNFNTSLNVEGTLTADTINVKNLVYENGSSAGTGSWTTILETELEGKGFVWAWGEDSIQLQYRSGKNLWTNASINLDASKSYKIDGSEVISLSELGVQVTKSNLKEVGTLKSLSVIGNSSLSEFAYFNSGLARLGLNTDEPNAALSIVENDVEIVIGSPNYGTATIGTYTNHSISIITDNTERLTVKNDGAIVFGSEATKTADVTIYGTLKVETLVSDTRIDRYQPLEFKATRDGAIYGKGLVWSGTGATRQLVMMAGPDRLWTSESIDIAMDQSYYINGNAVLSANHLGGNVTGSRLTSVGVLESLEVQGTAKFYNDLDVQGTAQLKTAVFTNGVKWLNITSSRINTSGELSINVAEDEVFYADQNEIAVGNKDNTRRAVKIYGPVSVGVSNPDPKVDLTIKGDVSFANKKFTTGTSAPTEGMFSQGDICWNQNPTSDNYIGWVCTQEGAPGVWLPFGAIARQ